MKPKISIELNNPDFDSIWMESDQIVDITWYSDGFDEEGGTMVVAYFDMKTFDKLLKKIKRTKKIIKESESGE